MRTKNLNLKKKIAFIASVAMIASTAAYLPAEVTKNIFNSSITVSAAAGVATDGYYTSDGNVKTGNDSNLLTDCSLAKRELFRAYVQVNGKYIGKLADPTKATKTYPAYQYFSSISAIENANAPANTKYEVFGELNDYDSANTTPTAAPNAVLRPRSTYGKENNTNIVNDLFEVDDNTQNQTVNREGTDGKADWTKYTGSTVTLPSIVKSTDVVTVKIVGNEKTAEAVAASATAYSKPAQKKGYIDGDDSIRVTLNAYGYGEIESGSNTVEVYGANYDDKTTEKGDKETVDLSGLKFKIEDQTPTKDKDYTSPEIVTVKKVNGTAYDGQTGRPDPIYLVDPADYQTGLAASAGTNQEIKAHASFEVTNPTAALADKNIKSYQYKRQSVNGTYCYTYIAELDQHIDPGKQIVIDLNKKTGQTITGTGVNDDGELTVKMGADGTAKSAVVTVSDEHSTEAVNYTYVIINGKTDVVNDEANIQFYGLAGLGTIDNKGVVSDAADNTKLNVAHSTVQETPANSALNINVTTEQESQQVLKGEKFVQKYTIATNDPVADYSVTDADDFEAGKRHRGFRMSLPNAAVAEKVWNSYGQDYTDYKAEFEFADADKVVEVTCYEFQTMPTKANDGYYWIDGDKIGIKKGADVAIDTTKSVGDAGYYKLTNSLAVDTVAIYPEAGKGANYTTPVLAKVKKFYNSTKGVIKTVVIDYAQFEFTTNYEIPIYNAKEENGIDVDTSKIIGYAQVGANGNGMEVARPENAKLGGWLFKQFNIVAGNVDESNNGVTKSNAKYSWTDTGNAKVSDTAPIYRLYSASSNTQGVNKNYQSYITGATAGNYGKVTPNSYIVAEYEANEYTINYDANGGHFTVPGENSVTLEEDKDSFATKVEVADLEAGKEDLKAVTKGADNLGGTVKREGYTFKGWNTDPNATTGMSYSAFKKARPSAKGEKMNLYAIWKAQEVKIEWLNIGFDDKGRSLAGTSKGDFTTTLTDGINANEDASITYKAGEKIGTLPTPTLRGYTFDGWYLCEETINPKTNVTEYSAKAIDENYVIDSGDMDNTGNLNLYAKFKQNSYNVTADYGVGKLTWIKDMESSGSGDDKVWKDKATGLYSVTDKEYQAGPEEIVEYKYDAKNKKVRFFDGEGNEITDNVTNIYDVRDGSGDYNVFRGFYINGGNTAIAFKDLSTQLAGFSKLEDLTLVAKFEAKKENTKGSMFLDTNGGTFYACKAASFTSPLNYIEDLKFDGGGNQQKDTHVSSILTVKDDTIKCETWKDNAGYTITFKDKDGNNVLGAQNVAPNGYYVIARPGYTFTGWYTDETCTTKFDFNTAMYEKGVEHKAYAGWKANNTTRYTLRFNLMNANGSFVPWNTATNAENPGSRCTASSEYEFQNTFMGTTDTVVKASDKEIEWNGKTYVYDAKLSANAKTERTVQAVYRVKDDRNTTVEEDCLGNGKFSLDDSQYTVIEGIYVEKGKESEPELEAPTAVKVNGNKVTWTGCDAAVKYQIKKVVNGKVSYSGYVETTEATIKNMPTEQFEIAVIAVDKKGNKLASDLKTVTPAASTLEAPTNVKVSDKGVVTWKAAKGAVKYQVLKVAGDSKAYTAKTTELTATLQPTSIDYTVYVIAFDANGKSVRSTAATGKAFASELGTVTDASYDKETATITWTAAKNATKYQICKVVDGKRYYSKYVTTTSYTFTNVPEGNFSYYVIAKDDAGNTTRGTMNKVTNHPSVTDVKLADDNKTVTFKAVEGATGYQLCKIAPGKNPAYTAVFTSTTKAFANACTSGTQVYVLAFFDEAHKDASYSETIIVK